MFISFSQSSSASRLVLSGSSLPSSPPSASRRTPSLDKLADRIACLPGSPSTSVHCPQLQHSSIHATDPKSCHYFLVAWLDGDLTGHFWLVALGGGELAFALCEKPLRNPKSWQPGLLWAWPPVAGGAGGASLVVRGKDSTCQCRTHRFSP